MKGAHQIVWDGRKVAQLWDWYSQNLKPENYFAKHSGGDIIHQVARQLDLEGKHIIDFGCGPGFLFEHLINKLGKSVGTYQGIDFSRSSVALITDKFGSHPSFRGAILAEAFPLDLPSEQAEVVFCVDVIEHLDDLEIDRTLREIRRLLAPGGAVVVTTPNCEDLEASKVICPECGCIFHRWQHMRSWTLDTLAKQIEKAGFRTTHATEMEFVQNGPWAWARKLVRALRKQSSAPHLIYIGLKE